MKKIIFLILMIFSINIFGFQISPDYFEQRFDGEGAFQEYTLKNESSGTIRYRFNALPAATKEKNMADWVTIQPKNMILKPGESKQIKVFAKAPEGTPIGDYAFYLAVESITIPELLKTDKENQSLEVKNSMGINISIQMFGWVGNLPAKVKVDGLNIYEKDKELYIKGSIKNETPKRFVNYKIRAISPRGMYENVYSGLLLSGKSHSFDTKMQFMKKKGDIEKIVVIEVPGEKVVETIAIK